MMASGGAGQPGAAAAFPALGEVSRAEAGALVEANTRAFLLALGRAGGGEERDDPHLRWTIGGSPIAYHNCVVHADLAAEDAEVAIEASIARFRAHGVPGSWHLGPSARPADLYDRLVAHGFAGGPGGEPGMAADLERLGPPDEAPALPEGLSIERVRDAGALGEWADVLALGFGEGPLEAFWVRDVYARIGLEDGVPWRHYLGRVAGEAVATASVFFAAGVAGLYFVSTAPAARQRGIGTAVTRAAMRAAAELGYRTAVLGASAMGYRVYQRLGFREFCRITIPEWTPPAP